MAENAQPTPETEAKKSRGFGSFVVWGVGGVMVYVLGSGPAFRYLWHDPSTPLYEVISYGYSPLRWAQWKTPLHKPLGIYWHIWCPKIYKLEGDLNTIYD